MEAQRFITGLLFLLSFNLFSADYVLVTDLDDTLKVTNGKRTASMVGNALFRRKVFAGMKNLFKELQVENIEKTYILSASPTVLMYNVRRLVRKHGIKVNGIYLRKTSELFKKREYKISRLERIIAQTKGQLILFGDNQSIDHEIYLEIKRRHPDRVARIYIHRVQPTHIPAEVFEYITPVEVALDLKEMLGADQIERVANSVLKARKFRRIVPKFSYCPTEPWIQSSGEEIFIEQLQNRIISVCKNRQD